MSKIKKNRKKYGVLVMYFKCDMCYKIIKELETHDYRREGESNGARSKKNKFDNIGG